MPQRRIGMKSKGGFLAAGLWLLLAGQAQAVNSNGPYYATPSWAQKLPAATRSQCMSRTTGGRKGWRLPSVHELASLVDPSVAAPGPTLPPGHPFVNVRSAVYWSATTRAEDPTLAWDVSFPNGTVGALVKTSSSHVWCVRGGHNDGSEY